MSHLSSSAVSHITSVGLTTQTAHHPLAVKSNYECIREGKHSDHGLEYSEAFVAVTVSRSAKHAAEERIRRDRLSRAIETLQSIIPSLNSVTERDKTSTKATTVERAIKYIISLKQELEQLKKETRSEHKKVGFTWGNSVVC